MRQATATRRTPAPPSPAPPRRRGLAIWVLALSVTMVLLAIAAVVAWAAVVDTSGGDAEEGEAGGETAGAEGGLPDGAPEGALQWQVPVADGAFPAVVTDDTVLTGQDARGFAGDGAAVRSFDAVTGEEGWNTEIDSPLAVPVGVAGGVAVVVGDGSIAGLHVEEGVTQWKFVAGPTPGSAATLLPVGVTPDRVIVGGETLTSLDPVTGDTQWDTAVTTEQLVADDDLVLAAGDGQVHAIALDTGAIEWTHDLENGAAFATAPAAAGDDVVAASGLGDVVVIDRDSGELRFEVLLDERADIPDDPAAREGSTDQTRLDRAVSLGVDADDGIMVVGGESGTIYGFALTDGERLWDRVVTVDLTVDRSLAVHADGDLAIVGGPGSREVAAYDLDTGLEEWNFDVVAEGDADVAPFVSRDLVYTVAASVDGRDLVALDLEGAEQWRVGLAQDAVAPLLAGGALVLAVSEQSDPAEAPVLFAVR